MTTEIVYAIHPFLAANDDEISFQCGDSIIVLEKDEMYADGWWLGQNTHGQIGLFPMNYTSYIKPIPHSSTSGPTTKNNKNNHEKSATENNNNNNNDEISPSLGDRAEKVDSQLQAQSPRISNIQSQLRELVEKSMSKQVAGNVSNIKEESSPTSQSKVDSNKSSGTNNSKRLSSASQDDSVSLRPLVKKPSVDSARTPGISNSHPVTWNLEQVCQWLREEGFDSEIDRFIENDITGDILIDLNQDSLKELNIISYGKRVRIVNAIKALRNDHLLNNKKIHNNKSNENSETNSDFDQDMKNFTLKSTTSGSTIDDLQPSTDSKTPSSVDKNLLTSTDAAATNTGFRGEKIQTITGKSIRKKGSKMFSRLHFASKGDKEDNEDSYKGDKGIDRKHKEERVSHHFPFRSKKKKGRTRSNSNGGWDFLDGEETEVKQSASEKTEKAVKRESKSLGVSYNLNGRKLRKRLSMDLIESKSRPSENLVKTEDKQITNGSDHSESDEDKMVLKNIGTPDHEGWLKKQSDKYKSWRNRYCILKGVNLYYLQSDKLVQTPRVKGHLNLTGYRIVSGENIRQGDYGFKLVHDTERTYYFAHENLDETRGWVKAIMKATISRDIKTPVVSSSSLATVSLSEARNMKRGNSTNPSDSRPSINFPISPVNKVASSKQGRPTTPLSLISPTSPTSPTAPSSMLKISPPILGRHMTYK